MVVLALPSSFVLTACNSAFVGFTCCLGIVMASQLDVGASQVTFRLRDGRLSAVLAAG